MARAKFTAQRGLNELVAQMIVDEVTKVAREVANEARRGAPPLKEWNSMRDPLVRHEHVRVDGQTRPMNLRFELPTHPWDRENRGLGPKTYLLYPRDQSDPRVIVNLRNCRCWLVIDPGGIADKVGMTPAVAKGTRVTASAHAAGAWVVQAEYGDVYPGGLMVDGSRFMARAAIAVAERRQAGTPAAPKFVAGSPYTAQMSHPASRVHQNRHEADARNGRRPRR